MAKGPLNEGLLTANRISELREQPVEGNFDAMHLKEVHRRIFQDLPHHAPGELRPDAPGHFKARELEAGPRYEVGYARGKDVGLELSRVLGELKGGEQMQGLNPDEFSARMAKLYGDLDHVHAFQEGNSRTLREFTSQVAEKAGYELDWGTTNADSAARDRLYMARDREVLERLYPGLNEARAMETDSRAEYEAYFTLEGLRRAPDLQSVIQENLRPLEVQQERAVVQERVTPLKGLDKEAFAEAAAGRLARETEQQDLTPAEQRQTAERLAQEGERRIQMEVITSERLRRDTQQAHSGDLEGLKQMFREATDRSEAALLKSAMRTLERAGESADARYLTVARVGQQYEGHLEARNARVALVATAEDKTVVIRPESLSRAVHNEQGQLQFTVPQGRGHGLDMEM